jgi:hypothetical protein
LLPTAFRQESLRLLHLTTAHPTQDAAPSGSWRKGPERPRADARRRRSNRVLPPRSTCRSSPRLYAMPLPISRSAPPDQRVTRAPFTPLRQGAPRWIRHLRHIATRAGGLMGNRMAFTQAQSELVAGASSVHLPIRSTHGIHCHAKCTVQVRAYLHVPHSLVYDASTIGASQNASSKRIPSGFRFRRGIACNDEGTCQLGNALYVALFRQATVCMRRRHRKWQGS